MEELLRTYYANLNPQATEEEILAYLQSQGIDMSAPQGIASLAPRVMPESGGDGGINNIVRGAGFGEPPGLGLSTLVTMFAPPVGMAMTARNLASKGQLPFGLNEIFGNEYTGSGINKEALRRGIESAESDSPDSAGMSSFDAAVSAGIQAAEDDI